jgi:hypothetical protein
MRALLALLSFLFMLCYTFLAIGIPVFIIYLVIQALHKYIYGSPLF